SRVPRDAEEGLGGDAVGPTQGGGVVLPDTPRPRPSVPARRPGRRALLDPPQQRPGAEPHPLTGAVVLPPQRGQLSVPLDLGVIGLLLLLLRLPGRASGRALGRAGSVSDRRLRRAAGFVGPWHGRRIIRRGQSEIRRKKGLPGLELRIFFLRISRTSGQRPRHQEDKQTETSCAHGGLHSALCRRAGPVMAPVTG